MTDNLGRYVIYQFNNFGNTTAVYNSAGQALYGRYAQDESASNRANQLLSSSRLQSAYRTGDTSSVTVQIGDTAETISLVDHVNLLSNGDISADISGTWTGTATTGTDGAVNVENAAGETRGGLDTNALHLTGKGMVSKRYTQTVSVSGTGDVATISMPGGGQYSYTYNDNHQLTRSVTATGLQEDYENTLNQVI